MSVIPTQIDVLFGRGTAINNHPGNQHFRTIVDNQKKFLFAVAAEDRKPKREVAADVMREVQKLGGRFLKEDSKSNISSNDSNKNQKKAVWNENNGSKNGHTNVHQSIVSKEWIHVEEEKVILKIMHRLREKRFGDGGGSQQQLLVKPETTSELHSSSAGSGLSDINNVSASGHVKRMANKPEQSFELKKMNQLEEQPAVPELHFFGGNIVSHHHNAGEKAKAASNVQEHHREASEWDSFLNNFALNEGGGDHGCQPLGQECLKQHPCAGSSEKFEVICDLTGDNVPSDHDPHSSDFAPAEECAMGTKLEEATSVAPPINAGLFERSTATSIKGNAEHAIRQPDILLSQYPQQEIAGLCQNNAIASSAIEPIAPTSDRIPHSSDAEPSKEIATWKTQSGLLDEEKEKVSNDVDVFLEYFSSHHDDAVKWREVNMRQWLEETKSERKYKASSFGSSSDGCL